MFFLTKHRTLFVCIFLSIATLSVYSQVKRHGFVNFDDGKYVYENPHVQNGLTLDSILWAFTTTHASNWHPITWLSHMLDCQIFGLNAGGHHLTSLLFHIGNTLLLLVILVRMTGALWSAFLVAALFALHPLHVESVAWVAERKDVLSTFLMMLTILAYTRYSEKPCAKRYAVVFICFLMGLLAKPMLVTLPFVLLLLDYWPLKRLGLPEKAATNEPHGIASFDRFKKTGFTGLLAEKTPLLLLSALSSIMTYVAAQSGVTVGSWEMYTINKRLANASVSYLDYLLKMLWPADLAVFYPYAYDHALWKLTAAVLVLVGITALAIATAKKRPYLVVGWLWYLGVLVPVIGLVQVGQQAMADRYTYIPLIGIFVMLAWGVPDILSHWPRRKLFFSAVTSVVFLILMWLTWKQVQHWENGISLFKHAIGITSKNWVAHTNLGHAFEMDNRINEATKQYLIAIQIKPDYYTAHYNLGNIYYTANRNNDAIKQYQEALRIKPDHAEAHFNLGAAFSKMERIDDAIKHFREAVRIKPDLAEAHNNLGIALAKIGRTDDAIKSYIEALRIKSDYLEAHYNLGNVLARTGRTDDAIKQYLEVLQIEPDDELTHYNLGIAFYRKGNVDKSVEHFQRAVQINPSFSQAREYLRKALVLQKRNQ